MFEDFEIKGKWWLPEKTENSVNGTLKFSYNDGISLELFGSFKNKNELHQMLRPEIILGISESNEEITLYKTFETNSPIFPVEVVITKFTVNFIFMGKHFDIEKDIKFHSLDISYTYLEEWMCVHPFSRESTKDNEKKEIIMKCKLLPESKIKLKKFNTILSIVPHYHLNETGFKSVKCDFSIFFRITPDKPKTFEWYQGLSFDLQNFLSLFIGLPVYPKLLTAQGEEKIVNKFKYEEKIKIYFSLPDVKIKKNIHFKDMIINGATLRNKLDIYINNWLNKAEILRPVYDLFLGTYYNNKMYLQFQFLSLAYSIETFHRRIYEGNYIPKSQYKLLCKTLIKAIPTNTNEELKLKLQSAVAFGNELSLQNRLESLLNAHWNNCFKYFVKDKDEFIDNIRHTRNYLTHYSKKLEKKAIKGIELYNLNERLKLFLIILLFIEVGLDKQEVHEVINNQYIFEHLKISDKKAVT